MNVYLIDLSRQCGRRAEKRQQVDTGAIVVLESERPVREKCCPPPRGITHPLTFTLSGVGQLCLPLVIESAVRRA